ncbi:MAG: hypothetical protein EON61_13760 [Alphaproteobacteria bacterium]|jgi:hypothetical protein|nr:MAG: hypothetical protein EON61_13760 [Alphaproteobacteria bacterium]
MTETIRIQKRFNGPHDSGNGGYSAGLAAQFLPDADAVEVTIRAPVPLDQTLRAHATETGFDIMTDDASTRILIMSLRPTWLETPNVKSPGLEAAIVAAASYRSAEDHFLPRCFVCGPARPVGDGLRIFSDWLKEPSGLDNPNDFPVVAAPWLPTPNLADVSGLISPEYMWAALDCPGAFAIDKEPILLGRMTAKILSCPTPNAPIVSVAWSKGQDRRKHFAGTALFDEAGQLLAFSEQVWIQIDSHAAPKEL